MSEHDESNVPQRDTLLRFDALYCSEEHWEEKHHDEICQRRVEVEESSLSNYSTGTTNPFHILLKQDLYWEAQELTSLLSKEEPNQLHEHVRKNPSMEVARREAVVWMLKVNAHYSFSALTAVLAINYLDKFLFSFHFQSSKPWMTHLAAVACLSLAAKVEETQAPLLLDLQVEESKYVFEAKTIGRMEILVLSTLEWKMNPVTPLSFLDYLTRRLELKGHLCWEFLRRCEGVLLSSISDSRFMCYLPSVFATAIMLQVVNGIEPCLNAEYHNQLLGILGLDKDKVEECSGLIQQLWSGCQGKQTNKRKIPGSPNDVMEVSFSSSDSSNDSWAVSSPSPEALSQKGRKSKDHQLLSTPSSDFLSFTR